MDIITHAGIGLVLAGPAINSHPELAIGLVAGSVLPDLDALSRVFGKCAYLRWHQTWTHALPVQAAVSALAGFAVSAMGGNGWLAGLGLVVGMGLHTLLDFTNTLGVKLFAPFYRKRLCAEWIFFIDAFVIALTMSLATLTARSFARNGEVPVPYAVSFLAILAGYVAMKGLLRRRAGRLAPTSITLIPSALWPWRFLGLERSTNRMTLFHINALSGDRKELAQHVILDNAHESNLAGIPEFRLMRELSRAYHVVGERMTSEGRILECRDLRTRNFKTTFGDLEVLLDPDGRALRTTFHV